MRGGHGQIIEFVVARRHFRLICLVRQTNSSLRAVRSIIMVKKEFRTPGDSRAMNMNIEKDSKPHSVNADASNHVTLASVRKRLKLRNPLLLLRSFCQQQRCHHNSRRCSRVLDGFCDSQDLGSVATSHVPSWDL